MKYLLADVRRLVCGIRYDGLDLWKSFRYILVYLIKCYAVVDIPGG